MKTCFSLFNMPFVRSVAAGTLVLAATAYAQTPTNPQPELPQADRPPEPPKGPVTISSSRIAGGVSVYSINFPGGTAASFFELLRTNGFPNDNVLFAGLAAKTEVPSFSVSNVWLKDIAKSLELVTAGRLSVEVVLKGQESEQNFWRVKIAENAPPLKARTCAMTFFFSRPNAEKRISEITETVEMVVARQLDLLGRPHEHGSTHTIASEKIVVVVGPEAYVEAVSSALEAAEKVAAGGRS